MSLCHSLSLDNCIRGAELAYICSFICIYGDLLEWLTGCGPASPTMAVFGWKGQKYRSYSVCKVECLRWTSVNVRIPKKWALTPVQGWTCQTGEGPAGKEQRLLSPCLYLSCHKKVWPGFKMGLLTSSNPVN